MHLSHRYAFPLKIIGYFLYGAMGYFMWRWFVVDAFRLPALKLPEAIGLSTLIRAVTDHYHSREEEELSNLTWHTIATPMIALVTGFMLHKWATLLK